MSLATPAGHDPPAQSQPSTTTRSATWSASTSSPADDFPSDDVGYGFDNIGDVLSLPPILMEKYLAAAEPIADKAIVDPEADRRRQECPPRRKTLARTLGEAIEAESAHYPEPRGRA